MKTIGLALIWSTQKLKKAQIKSARLDSELLLAHAMKKSRTWVLAHSNDPLTHQAEFVRLIARRLSRVPMAYLLGYKEFYGRTFTVNQDVLIPRPESEAFFEVLSVYKPQRKDCIIDIGTGSGNLAVTSRATYPHVPVIASDTSPHALSVAAHNARQHEAAITFYHSDLLTDIPLPLSERAIILANLPYVDRSWEQSPELSHEPEEALYSDKKGLAHSVRLLQQIRDLPVETVVLLETDRRQLPDLRRAAEARGFKIGVQTGLISSFIYIPRASR